MPFHGQVPCPASQVQFALLYRELLVLRTLFSQTYALMLQSTANQNPVLRDAEYVMERIGASARSLQRFQKRGDLPVFERKGRRKYYRDEDVEEFFRKYRGK